MDRKTTAELVRILTTTLQRDFLITVCPEAILQRVNIAAGDSKDTRTLVCIGSSIMKQTVPYLRAMGYNIIDMTKPGWLATEENISELMAALSKLNVPDGFAVVLDLLGNCSVRFQNFDSTLSMAQKDGGHYHMKGLVVACSEDIFGRIVKALSPVMLSAQNAVKVSIPPHPGIYSMPAVQIRPTAQICCRKAMRKN
jgi:hypothetical protein